MCELIIYIGPSSLPPDGELHPMHYRSGDVVEARLDGWLHLEAKVRTDPLFRVLVFPGVDPSEADHLIKLGAEVSGLDKLMNRRRCDFRINLEHPALAGEKVRITGVTIQDLTIRHPPHPLHVRS